MRGRNAAAKEARKNDEQLAKAYRLKEKLRKRELRKKQRERKLQEKRGKLD